MSSVKQPLRSIRPTVSYLLRTPSGKGEDWATMSPTQKQAFAAKKQKETNVNAQIAMFSLAWEKVALLQQDFDADLDVFYLWLDPIFETFAARA